MKKKLFSLMMLLLLGVMPSAVFAYSGSGTSASPYLIQSASDWNTFAAEVANGNAYSGVFFKLTSDISVTTMAGTSSNPFSGTFDGNNKTITVDYTATTSQCALFPLGRNLTIKNLKVAGNIETAYVQAAGFIGYLNENGTITDCVSDVTINSTFSGMGKHGGFIGELDSQAHATFTNCVFTGRLLGTNTDKCGGFVGWVYSRYTYWAQSGTATAVFNNCIFAPKEVTIGVGSAGPNLTTSSATFCRAFPSSGASGNPNTSGVTINNCYYTQTFGTTQGSQIYAVSGDEDVTVNFAGSPNNTTGVVNTNYGMSCDGAVYVSGNQTLSLDLNYTGNLTCTGFTASTGALSGSANPYSLTIGTQNIVISANTTSNPVNPGQVDNGPIHVAYTNEEGVEIVDSLNLGTRPVGAWMAPFEFRMYSEGPTYKITDMDVTPIQGLFTFGGEELPFQITPANDADLTVSTAINTSLTGVQEGLFVALSEGNRAAHMWPIKVELYNPAIPDVVEKPYAINLTPGFSDVRVPARITPTTLHNDYTLPFPEIPEGFDAVYKLTVPRDMMISASVSQGENGKVALYKSDFNGEPGPMAHNNYTGLELAQNSRDIVEIGTGTSTAYYLPVNMYFRYSLTEQIYTADEIGTAGTISSISFYLDYNSAFSMPNQKVYMKNVTRSNFANNSDMEAVAESDLVFNGTFSATGAGWVTINLDTPFQYDGTSNLLIAFHNGTYYYPGSSWKFRYTNTSDAKSIDWYSDSYNPDLNNLSSFSGSKYTRNYRANIQIDITAQTHSYTAGPVIENLPLTAGTYYLVSSSTDPGFEVTINAENMPCPEVAYAPSPADDEVGIQPSGVTLHWTLPDYATEWRLVFGSTYYPEANHPQTVMTEWSSDLEESFTLPMDLWNNTNYFWRIEVRNGGANGCTTVGPVWGFTTHLNAPDGLVATPDEIYEGETTTLTWNAIQDRTFRSYKIYKDGDFIGNTTVTPNPNGYTSYVVPASELEYNPDGYEFTVTAMYDEGESLPSNSVTVKVGGYSAQNGINGYVYEVDGTTPIGGVTVTVTGTTEFGVDTTFSAITGQNGYYEMQVVVGEYTTAIATCPGYQDAEPYQNAPNFSVAHNAHHDNMNFIMDELFLAPAHVCAEVVEVEGEELVKVWWDWNFFTTLTEDFEDWANTPYAWQNDAQYPWTLTTEAHEGTYALKSGNAGMGGTTSTLEVTVDIPQDGMFSFDLWSRGESTTDTYDWDVSRFYIDGQQKFQYGQHAGWETYSTAITAGTHTFRWVYKKDATVNPAQGDCFMIDNIKFVYNPEDEAKGMTATRALDHYRIYRTDCYNYGPFTAENTILLATAWVPDTAYFDVSWPTTAPGVYKWGVGVVYAGNNPNNPNNGRESEITWSEGGSRDAFTYDFEDGLQGWTMIDADGDGYNWVHSSGSIAQSDVDYSGYGHDGSNAFAYSQSYYEIYDPYYDDYDYASLNPNNFMVSPQQFAITNNSSMKFYYDFRSSSYLDHFGVAVATAANPTAADFAMVWENSDKGSRGPREHGMENRVNNWREVTIDLSAYAGQNVWIAFRHFNSYDNWEVWVDDVTINAGGAPTPGPTPTPGQPSCDNELALPRESCTMWSDMCAPCIDKDMELDNVTVNVVLNSADSPEGTTVTFTNLNEYEQLYHPIEVLTLGETGYYAYETFRRGYYAVAVEHEGYYPIYDTVDLWTSGRDLRYVMTEILYPVKNLYVSRTGWAMWEPMTDADGIYPEDMPAEDRHLEYYKVMCTSIDGEPIFNADTEYPFCQVETDELVNGANYIVKVAVVYSTGVSRWRSAKWQYESCENYAPATDVTMDGNTISWTYPGGDGPTPSEGSTFSYDFENVSNGNFGDWTAFQGTNGDSQNGWMTYDQHNYDYSAGYGHNSSTGFVYSESYITGPNTAVHPDNYLVSPQVTLGSNSVLSFWVTDANDEYGAEHFTVEVSTGSNNNAADFTAVFEQTLLSKGSRSGRDRDLVNDRVWYNYTVDLSAYAGQQAYIAFHHFNCYDQWFLALDDVELSNGAKGFRANREVSEVQLASVSLNGQVGNYSNRDEWLTYANSDELYMAYGFNGNMIKMANYHPATQMAAFNGYNLTKVSFPAYCNVSGNIEIYQGGTTEPATLVYTQPYNLVGSGEPVSYNDITLDTPVAIDGTQSLWVVVASANYTDYPFCCVEGNTANGEYVYLEGYGWNLTPDVSTYGGVWMLRAYVEEGTTPTPTPAGNILGAMVYVDGEWEAFVPYPTNTYDFEGDATLACVRVVYGGDAILPDQNFNYAMSCGECTPDVDELCAAGAPIFAETMADDQVRLWWNEAAKGADIVSYNIYRANDSRNYSLIGEVAAHAESYYEYIDAPGAGTYYYQVTAVHADGCESRPAISGENPTQDFVVVGVTGVNDLNSQVALFPNPTKGNVTIQAQGMNRVTVVSVLGQVVLDTELNADEYTVNMSQFNAGMYMVRVYTENGMAVKRVTVMQ